MEDVSLSPGDIVSKSTTALNNAMSAIYQMARRTAAVVREIPVPERPQGLELEFNLKLTTEAGVVIAKGSLESTINVKLTWERQDNGSDEARR
jgi:hypothetical protein